MCPVGSLKEYRERGQKKKFEEIMAKTFLSIMKTINPTKLRIRYIRKFQ